MVETSFTHTGKARSDLAATKRQLDAEMNPYPAGRSKARSVMRPSQATRNLFGTGGCALREAAKVGVILLLR